MARNLYLRCVGGRWDWRRRIPSHLVERFGGRRELVRSIGSVPHAAAKERARQFTTAADELFQMIAKSPELTADQIDSLVADYFRHRLESKDAWRARFRPEDPEEHDRALATADTLAEGAGELLKMNDVGVATEAAQALLEKHGLVASKNNPVFGDLKRALLRAEAEVARLHAARLRGNYRTQPLDPLVTSALSNADEGVQPKAKRRKALALTECWYRYTEARTKAKAWGADMARLVADTHTLFLEWAGDKPLDSYSRADVAAFIEMLQCLPALRGKVPNFTGKPLSDLVAMTKANPSIACLSPRSVKKHANNLSTFFTWAVDQGIVTENPAKGVFKAPKRTTRRNEERSAWTVDQLKRLFSSPLYRGCKSAARRSEPGSMVIRDARYWLPLLGAFHPVRLEEIAQLRVEDIRQESGIWFLDIRGDEGRRVKTLASWRRVPLHQVVLDLGFLEHVEKSRCQGMMTFPDLEAGGAAGRFGYSFSKWFGRYRDDQSIREVDFHGFRHATITALVRAGVHPDVVNQLDGHEIPGERGRYSKGVGLPDLKRAIDQIAYAGIDASFITGKPAK